MKTGKQIFSMLITLAVVLCALTVGVSANEADAKHTGHDGWTEWKSGTKLPSESGKYVLTKDINLSETTELAGLEITICLNGKTVKHSGGAFYKASSNSVLTVCDCTAQKDAEGNYTAGVFTGATEGAFVIDGESTFNLYDGKISENTSVGDGGIIVVQGGSVMNMSGGEISGNQALEGSGGAVYIFQKGTFHMSDGLICNNRAAVYGGAVYTGDQFNMSGGILRGNHSGMEGGAVYITSSEYAENGQYILSDGVMNMSGGLITENTTDHNGAGVVVRGEKGIFNLQDGVITKNSATNGVTGSGHGGGVLTQSKGTINIYGGEISDNVCVKQGGGVRTASGSVVNLHGGVISGNTANRGAGVYLQADMNIYGGEITGNIATTEGAGLYVEGSKVLMEGGEITQNRTLNENGGGIVCKGGQLVMQDGLVEGNECAGHGGGVLVFAEGKFSMHGGRISGNKANGEGGGIRSNTCTVEVYGGEILNNTADIGAGVYVGSDGVVKLLGGTVKGNTASSGGGAMRAAGTSNVTLGSVTITENVGGTTGGVHYAKGTMAFAGAPVITGNTLTDGTPANFLYEAQEGSSMSLAGLEEGARIGLTLHSSQTAVTASGATDVIASCFLPDAETELIWRATANGLELGAAPEPTEPPTTEAPTEPTGDSSTEPSSPVIWIGVAVAAAAVAVIAVVISKKKK